MKKGILSAILCGGALLALSLTAACTKRLDDVATTYTCDSGETITVHYYGRESAKLTYKGKESNLTFLLAGPRARYGGDSLEWIASGTRVGAKGELFQQNAGIAVEPALEICRRTE